jgi:hypothetical protein
VPAHEVTLDGGAESPVTPQHPGFDAVVGLGGGSVEPHPHRHSPNRRGIRSHGQLRRGRSVASSIKVAQAMVALGMI